MEALDLLTAHRYAEAIQAYRTRLQAEPGHWPSIAGLARALQASGSYAEALPLLERVDEYERRLPGSPGRKIDMACVCWCLDDRMRAKQLIRAAAEGILDRSIEFADLAGGVQQGALLYFMGIATQDVEATEFALSYLRKLSGRKSRIKCWPGPVALYLLGQIDTEALLIAACGQSNVIEASRAVENDILARRQLCVALFYVGIRFRAQGMEAECFQWMQTCIALKNPLVEPEWYLAKHEMELNRPHSS